MATAFCLRQLLPGTSSRRIKADASPTGIRQHGVNFFKRIADTGISVLYDSTRLRSHRAGLGMITTNHVSTFTILQFNTTAPLLP